MSLSVDVRKRLGSFSLDVSFEAEDPREICALLGPSGCGKSLTLKCIAGVLTPDEGRIVLGDRVLFDSAAGVNLPPQRRRVGYLFQQYALFPNMTVEKNIEAGAVGTTSAPGALPSRCAPFTWRGSSACDRRSSPAASSSALRSRGFSPVTRS